LALGSVALIAAVLVAAALALRSSWTLALLLAVAAAASLYVGPMTGAGVGAVSWGFRVGNFELGRRGPHTTATPAHGAWNGLPVPAGRVAPGGITLTVFRPRLGADRDGASGLEAVSDAGFGDDVPRMSGVGLELAA
jgi:hypothetical protein